MLQDILRYFPYEDPREGQIEIAARTYETLVRGETLAIEAPNGIGKTSAVLSGALLASERSGRRILYLTRTHSQTDRVVEEVEKISKKAEVVYAPIRGMASLCPFNTGLFREGIFCSFIVKKRICNYTKSVDEVGDVRPLFTEKVISEALKRGQCPYAFSIRLAKDSTLIIANYIYVFDMFYYNYLFEKLRLEKPFLIIDEAHNVSDRILDFLRARARIDRLYDILSRYSSDTGFNGIIRLLDKVCESNSKIVSGEILKFVSREEIIKLREFLDKMPEKSEEVEFMDNSFMDAVKFLRKLEIARENAENMVFCREGKADLLMEPILPGDLYGKVLGDKFSGIVMISGTFGGKEALSTELGIDLDYMEINPRREEELSVFIAEGITTSYRKREKELYKAIAEVISEIPSTVEGNIGIFFPSYQFMERVYEEVRSMDKPVFLESREKTARENREMIENFKRMADAGGAVLFGVLGGRNSEGEDFIGKEMSSAIVVGLPYRKPNDLMRLRASKINEKSPGMGYKVVFTLPAVRMAVQAAARSTRGHRKKVAVVFADDRYKRSDVIEFLPSWVKERISYVKWRDLPEVFKRIWDNETASIQRKC
ncbi:MAG: ATP-dependent DNA helicase [Candidatus Methanodesulfokora washburnensis]